MMWPDIRKRIYSLWSQAYHPSSNPNEAANARAMLAELHADLNISDVEVAFIAEAEEKKPAGSDDSERAPDVFELLVHLFDGSGIILNFAQVVIVALWILFSYIVFDFYMHAPRLLLRSHKPGCGKTTLLSFINLLVDNGFKSDNASAASLYTRLQECPRTTFSVDEMENSTLWSRDNFLRAFFDSGHRYDGCFSRQVRLKRGKTVSLQLSVFALLAYALVVSSKNKKIRVPEQLLSRSLAIDVRFHPEGRDEILPNDPRIAEVRRWIREWAPTFQPPPACEIPFVGRDRDNFRPLIEIAETLGYGATARAAALAIHRPSEDLVKPLLFDINQVFEHREIKGIWTPELLDALYRLPNAHWDEFRGLDGSKDPHKLTRAELYDLLGELDPPIESRSVQKVVGGNGERKSTKGFYRTQFEPHWRALFGGTPAQASKIIRLTRHKKSQTGDTD